MVRAMVAPVTIPYEYAVTTESRYKCVKLCFDTAISFVLSPPWLPPGGVFFFCGPWAPVSRGEGPAPRGAALQQCGGLRG